MGGNLGRQECTKPSGKTVVQGQAEEAKPARFVVTSWFTTWRACCSGWLLAPRLESTRASSRDLLVLGCHPKNMATSSKALTAPPPSSTWTQPRWLTSQEAALFLTALEAALSVVARCCASRKHRRWTRLTSSRPSRVWPCLAPRRDHRKICEKVVVQNNINNNVHGNGHRVHAKKS